MLSVHKFSSLFLLVGAACVLCCIFSCAPLVQYEYVKPTYPELFVIPHSTEFDPDMFVDLDTLYCLDEETHRLLLKDYSDLKDLVDFYERQINKYNNFANTR